jgi:hypothetical protein
MSDSAIIVMCAFCGRVRRDGKWEYTEHPTSDGITFARMLSKSFEGMGADVSHTYCDDCVEIHFPQYVERLKLSGTI